MSDKIENVDRELTTTEKLIRASAYGDGYRKGYEVGSAASRPGAPPEAPETKQAYRNGFEEGFEIGKAQCETHHEDMKAEAAAQAREKLFETIRAERDPHLDYVDWDSIEAAYMRTGGDER